MQLSRLVIVCQSFVGVGMQTLHLSPRRRRRLLTVPRPSSRARLPSGEKVGQKRRL